MKTKIFYFSATGNSLTTAYKLSQFIKGDCELIPIAELRDYEIIKVDADAVGIVFPVYEGNMPYIVREAIKRMEFVGRPYIFSVSTYRKWEVYVARSIAEILQSKGQDLAYNYLVRMPGNSSQNTAEVDQILLHMQDDAVKLAAELINNRECMADYVKMQPVNMDGLSLKAENSRGITADDNCMGCGTCVSVCPMGNIRILDNKAVIGDNCLTCLACFHWCPIEAIYMSKDEKRGRRSKYHHPEVSLQDFI